MKNNFTLLSVGSNIEPENNVAAGIEILKREQNVIDISRFAFTKPIGFQQQDDFYNGAIFIKTTLNREGFNLYLKEVEKRLGRIKGSIKSGPRTIDLDIIIWNGKIVHPDYEKQSYVKDFVDELLEKHSIEII